MSAVRLLVCVLSAGLAGVSVPSPAQGQGPIRKPSFDPAAERVELFEGVEREQLSVRVVPRNSFEARVFITNPTDEPLTVVLPEGVAAVHVLKQFLPPGGIVGANDGFGPGLGAAQGQGQGAAQSVGGNFMGPLGQGQGNNFGANAPFGNQFPGGGLFSIPPGKTVEVNLATVCLDHGRPDPSPRMAYALRRLGDQTDDPVLKELIRGYDPARDDRMARQAAVWHQANGVSWQELQAKTLPRGPLRYAFFTRRQIEAAQELVSGAEELARERGEPANEARVAGTGPRRS